MARSGNISGINAVIQNLQNIRTNVQNKVVQAVTESCLDLQRRSVELAPVDTGDMRGSAKTDVEANSNQVKGTVSFNTPYALEQHETLWYNHPRGGQAKYLEQPARENEERYKNNIKDATRDGVG